MESQAGGQMAKLQELEHLLESTEVLSPLTLEMVQSALMGLKEKRAEHVARGQVEPRVPVRDIRSFFPDSKHVMVKGDAPLLVPHPGDNMVPMTDEAIMKQDKLRNLRHEMMLVSGGDDVPFLDMFFQMKKKIANLEEQGINPTREHVQSHLHNIRTFSIREFEGWSHGCDMVD